MGNIRESGQGLGYVRLTDLQWHEDYTTQGITRPREIGEWFRVCRRRHQDKRNDRKLRCFDTDRKEYYFDQRDLEPIPYPWEIKAGKDQLAGFDDHIKSQHEYDDIASWMKRSQVDIDGFEPKGSRLLHLDA